MATFRFSRGLLSLTSLSFRKSVPTVPCVSPLQRVNSLVYDANISSSSSSGYRSSILAIPPSLAGIRTDIQGCMLDLFNIGVWLIKRTFQPSLIRRKRKHGFLARAATKDGVHVLNRRRQKGRRKLCA